MTSLQCIKKPKSRLWFSLFLFVVSVCSFASVSGLRADDAEPAVAPEVTEKGFDEATDKVANVDDAADAVGTDAAEDPEPKDDEPKDDVADAEPDAEGNDDPQPVPVLGIEPAEPRKRPKCDSAALIRFEGPIRPMNEHYFYRKLDEAKGLGVDLVIVEIDSPGGYVDSSFNLANRIRDINWAEVVVFIPEEAISGAAIMALGSSDIIIKKDALMGDAGPIFRGPDALFRHAPEKIRSDIALRIRKLADFHDRPAALAEAMVDMDLVVYAVTNKATGFKTFMSDEELDSVEDPAAWIKGKPVFESRKDKFLEVDGERAVELRLAEGNAPDREAVCKMFQVKDELIVLEPRAIDTAVVVLNNPFITGLLFIVGLIALYIELSAPGIGFGGLISILCFALFFWSRFLGGTSGMLEVILFAVGVAFLAVEVFVLPGFGIPGVTGLLLMLAGVLLASNGFVVPQTGNDLQSFASALTVIVGSGVVFLFGATMISRRMGSIPVLRSFALEPTVASTGGGGETANSSVANIHPLVAVGDEGVADSALRPSGRAKFGEEYLDVVADGSFVSADSPIRVINISGNRVMVREIERDSGKSETT